MTVPRKLPRTQDQRVQNVSRNHAAQSLGGATAAARPVANVKPDVKLYQPASSATQDRLIVTTDVSGLSGTGAQDITSWASVNVAVGTSVALGSPDDGGIYLDAAGVYAVTVKLAATIHAAPVSTSVSVILDCPQIWTTPVARLRGGDGSPGYTDTAASSTTHYCAGGGAAIYPTVIYQSLDPSVTSVNVRICVQRIT